MSIKVTFSNLEGQLLCGNLSADEYFVIIIQTCEHNVDLAKIELRNVLRRLEENYTNAKEQIYSNLKDLYDNFFDIRTTSDITPNSPSSKDGSDCDLNSLSIAPPQINDENINNL